MAWPAGRGGVPAGLERHLGGLSQRRLSKAEAI
jgi:hypothetical protein